MRKVFIVDTDEGVCEFLVALLTDEGFQVSAAACDSWQALELLQHEDDAVVLVDLGRPASRQHIHAWLEQVHELTHHQAIAMSASAPVALGYSLLGERLITAFLPKPFDLDEVLAAVQQVATT